MLLSSLVVLVVALGGEFPVYSGLVGGAPINDSVSERVSEILGDVSPWAGALRHVENSGICGGTSLLKLLPACCSLHDRNYSRCVLSLRVCGPHFHTTYVVLVLCGPQQPRHRTANSLVEWWSESLCLSKPPRHREVLDILKPGSSSMIGLFEEHGPCLINNDSSTVRLNPQSWNQDSNVYVFHPAYSIHPAHHQNPACT